MRTRELAVVSIHPEPADPLGVDLKQILSALGVEAGDWVWCVSDLDCLGVGAEEFCLAVSTAGACGYWIGADDLQRRAQGIVQTIEGQFLAFPKSLDRTAISAKDLDLWNFPSSQAELAIIAIDGCYFDVYSKDTAIVAMLRRRFADARIEDPSNFFAGR